MAPVYVILTLVILGLLALVAEFLLFAGVGISGIVGLGALIYACVYAFTKVGVKAGSITTAVVCLIVVVVLIVILKGKTWKKLELKDEIQASAGPDVSAVQPGEKGRTITRLAPMGTAIFNGVRYEVKSFDGSMIDPSADVEVVSVEDNQICVKVTNNQ